MSKQAPRTAEPTETQPPATQVHIDRKDTRITPAPESVVSTDFGQVKEIPLVVRQGLNLAMMSFRNKIASYELETAAISLEKEGILATSELGGARKRTIIYYVPDPEKHPNSYTERYPVLERRYGVDFHDSHSYGKRNVDLGHTVYAYNSDGRPTQRLKVAETGARGDEIAWQYYDNGRVKHIEEYDSYRKTVRQSAYDTHGRETIDATFDRQSQHPLYTIERKYPKDESTGWASETVVRRYDPITGKLFSESLDIYTDKDTHTDTTILYDQDGKITKKQITNYEDGYKVVSKEVEFYE